MTLDRAISLQHRGLVAAPQLWAAARDEIRTVVLARGFSERMGAFRQRYDIDTLDAAALLIPIVGFLPPDDRRVLGTIERIMESLTIDDLVYRFAPRETPGQTGLPLGQLEGAHVPATLWLASALVLAGDHANAERLLAKIDGYAGELGLLAEEIDPRHRASTGRYPLVFSHAEYLRLITPLGRSR